MAGGVGKRLENSRSSIRVIQPTDIPASNVDEEVTHWTTKKTPGKQQREQLEQ